jgi:C4-dicarboxylate-specific signal transduction histidine kinase
MSTNAVTALEVTDEPFLIASLIERCPKTAMLRELMMNALEAARHAPAGRRLVEISEQQIDGVSKLTLWNTGPGVARRRASPHLQHRFVNRKREEPDRKFWHGGQGRLLAV